MVLKTMTCLVGKAISKHIQGKNKVKYYAQELKEKLMPQFCEMIDKGDFYIACAMGLHRTDIALCTYWVFYAADKGIASPPIRGYRQEDGHNTLKIMYVLNSIYKYMTEQNGVEPILMGTFKERR